MFGTEIMFGTKFMFGTNHQVFLMYCAELKRRAERTFDAEDIVTKFNGAEVRIPLINYLGIEVNFRIDINEILLVCIHWSKIQ